MKKLMILMIAALFVVCLSSMAMAQAAVQTVNVTVPTIKMAAIAPAGPIALTITAPAQAGNPPAAATNNTTYLQYTVLTNAATNITAAITAGTIPTGTSLTLQPAAIAGATGTPGTPVGAAVTLSGVAQNIITGVGNCYTGITATSGSRLTYSFQVSNFATVVPAASTPLTVTLTVQ